MKPAALVSILFLALVAVAHAFRFLLQVDITIGHMVIPMWASAFAAVGVGALAGWLWKEQQESARHP